MIGTLATTGVAAVVFGGVLPASLDYLHKDVQDGYMQPLTNFKNGTLDPGMVAVQGGEIATPTEWVRDHVAADVDVTTEQSLIAQVAAQADSEGYAGVQPNDTLVVPADEVNRQTRRELSVSPVDHSQQ
jgi:hypothetical protein